MREFTHEVNGVEETATYDSQTINEVLIPLLRRWSELARGLHRKMVIFLAGPPCAGKSNLALSLQELSHEESGLVPLIAMSLDGFFYSNDYLKHHALIRGVEELRLSQIKGAPETYDLNRLRSKLIELRNKRQVQIPVYSERDHEVNMSGKVLKDHIVLVEGSYLLLDEPGWRGLSAYCNDSVFLDVTPSELKSRVLKYESQHGIAKSQAEINYTDKYEPNIRRVLSNRLNPAVTLEQSGINHLMVRKPA